MPMSGGKMSIGRNDRYGYFFDRVCMATFLVNFFCQKKSDIIDVRDPFLFFLLNYKITETCMSLFCWLKKVTKKEPQPHLSPAHQNSTHSLQATNAQGFYDPFAIACYATSYFLVPSFR